MSISCHIHHTLFVCLIIFGIIWLSNGTSERKGSCEDYVSTYNGTFDSLCNTCSCQNGVTICQKEWCPDPGCKEDEDLHQVSSQCCPFCLPKSTKTNCLYHGRNFRDGSEWAFSPCEKCYCHDGQVQCVWSEKCETKNCSLGWRLGHLPNQCCPTCILEKNDCVFNGSTFPSGATWFPLDCVVCRCTKGLVDCYSVDCPPPAFCKEEIRINPSLRKCCPNCKGRPCLQGLETFQDGQMWKKDSCTNCACYDGNITCEKISCPPRDSYKCNTGTELMIRPGDCCPSCVGAGVPCVYDSAVHFSGDVWASPNCEYCSCRNNSKVVCSSLVCHPTTCPLGKTLVQENNRCCPECVEDQGICSHGSEIYQELDVIGQEGCHMSVCYRGHLVDFVNNSCNSPGIRRGRCKHGVVYNGECRSHCPQGYFQIYKYCRPCAFGCLDCFSGGDNHCKKCEAHLWLHRGQCLSHCPPGFFPLDRSCLECHYSCQTCTGPGKDKCLSCAIAGQVLDAGQCIDECHTVNTYVQNGQCVKCPSQCTSCAFDQAYCKSCQVPYLLQDGKCQTSCDIGFFPSANRICSACHPSCLECKGPTATDCIRCQEDHKLLLGFCVKDCGLGFFVDPTAKGICKVCHPQCAECMGAADDQCLSCSEGLLVLEKGNFHGKCLKECPVGFYVTSQGTCEECHTHLDQNHQNSSCMNQCFPGHYDKNGICTACTPHCLHCTKSGLCQRCRGKKVLQFGECADKCESRYYLDRLTGHCKECSWRCKTCYGPSSHDCLSCMPRMVLERGVCLVKCSDGFYADGGNCKACSSNCQTCKNHNFCTSCSVSSFLLRGGCATHCGVGRFSDNKTRTCKRCPSNCIHCENQHTCISCKDGFFLLNGKCVTLCGQKSFEDRERRVCTESVAAPQVFLHGPLTVWPGSYTPLSSVLTVNDSDTSLLDVVLRVVQRPFTATLQKYINYTHTESLQEGDVFTYLEMQVGSIGVYIPDNLPVFTKDIISLKAEDGLWESPTFTIPIHAAVQFRKHVSQTAVPIIAKGGYADPMVQVQNVDIAVPQSDLKFYIIAGPKHGYLFNTTSFEKLTTFSESDLRRGHIHYLHDGSDSQTDLVLVQAQDNNQNAVNKIFMINILKAQIESTSMLVESYEPFPYHTYNQVLNHQEVTLPSTSLSIANNITFSTVPSVSALVSIQSESVFYFANEAYYCEEESSVVEVEIIRIGGDISQSSYVWCSTHSTKPPSALPGKDFRPLFEKIDFLPGQTKAICTVTILDDSSDPHLEGREMLMVTLSNPSLGVLHDPYKTIITIDDTAADVPVMQFLLNEIHVSESEEKVQAPIVRNGDLSFTTSVRCYTEGKTAKVSKDFYERPNTDESIIYFFPQEELKNCTVQLFNDKRYEEKETFLLHLGSPQSTKLINVVLGNIQSMTIIISNEEDAPKIQFEKSSYSVAEPNTFGSMNKARLGIIRTGDAHKSCKFRVSTQDGTAMSGHDYHAKSEILTLQPKESRVDFEVEILYQERRAWNKVFTVVLGPGEPSNAEVGDIAVATVQIIDHEVSGGTILPAPPVVVSLLFYDNVKVGLSVDPSPGYPVVCVSPCDSHHPEFAYMESLCKELGITNTSHYYSWEVAVPGDEQDLITPFQKVTDETLFTSVHHKVLDSIYFRQHFLVRCIAQPKDAVGNLGVPLSSKAVKIGQKNGICNVGKSNLGVLHSQPFSARINYINSTDTDLHNRLRITVEIPHQDGMLPLISTLPINSVHILLSNSIYRQQHVCSNFLLGSGINSQPGFVNVNEPAFDLAGQSGFHWPYQLHSGLRGSHAVTLYKHLDLQRCLWKFEAVYTMHELVDKCGGFVDTNFQVRDVAVKYVTVHIPLYVSYVYVVAPTGWASADHRTELEFSFYYKSVLGQRGLETGGALKATVEVSRILINAEGRLVVEFRTRAKYRGMFVISHQSIPSEKSKMYSVERPDLNFDLVLVWSQDTFDGPTQLWKATSRYNLKDYSGTYIIELVPCTVITTYAYQRSVNSKPVCVAQKLQKFTIPISFQQSARPVPAIYSLNSIFQLLNSEDIFLADPLELPATEFGYIGTFNKGQTVYGRVLWHPDQDLKDAYQLQIDRVYLCTGKDGYIPTFDPTGTEYGLGPQFGCVKPSNKLRYRFLLLDRHNSDVIDAHFHNIPFNAKFSSALRGKNGVDGFHFLVDALYKVESGHDWYIQVLYTILPSKQSSKSRKRRSMSEGTALPSPQGPMVVPDNYQYWNSTRKHNGTNMCLLQLAEQGESEGSDAQLQQTSISPAFVFVICCASLLTLLMCSVITHRYWKKWHRQQLLLCQQNDQSSHVDITRKQFHVKKKHSRKNIIDKCHQTTVQKEIVYKEKQHIKVVSPGRYSSVLVKTDLMECTEV